MLADILFTLGYKFPVLEGFAIVVFVRLETKQFVKFPDG
jgi:hypothetical protein